MQKTAIVTVAILALLTIGCAAKQPQTTVLALVCEYQTVEGQDKPQKVCFEAREGQLVRKDQEKMTLVCENKATVKSGQPQKVCKQITGIECENRVSTGSHIAKLVCEPNDFKNERSIDDQLEVETLLRHTEG